MGLSYQVELKVHKMLHQGFGREEICKRLGVSDHFVRKELDKGYRGHCCYASAE